jgi:adenylate cyclase
MSLSENLKQNWRAGALGATLAIGVGVVLLRWPFTAGEMLIHLSYDLPFHQRPVIHPSEVVLVYLDDDSHRELGQPEDAPWDRGLYARLVERLTAEGARAVTFDIVFNRPNAQHPEGDERFTRAIKANGRVVLGADYTTAANGGMTFIRPIDQFIDAAAAWGMVQVFPDQDFVVRLHLHIPPGGDFDIYSSVAWELARVAGSEHAKDPKQRDTERWLNHYGPPGAIPSMSFLRALETNNACPAGFFANKVVIVGSSLKTMYSGQRKDELRTPYTRSSFCPAVDLQGTQVLNLIRGDWITRISPAIELVLIVLGGAVFGFCAALVRPLAAVGLAVANVLALVILAQFLLTYERLWFPWMIPAAAQIPVAALFSVVFNSVRLYVQNRLYEESLRMYLSPKLVKKFANNKDLLKPGAKKQTITALFTDIANFTSISEGLDSDELALAMNAYFDTAVSECVHATDGTVVKYIGDAIFAFWNAPDTQEDHAFRACEAALRFAELPPRYINQRLIFTRLGLHTGSANVGNFGSSARVDYTAIGESINLASRMEGLNKYLGTRILITAETHAEIDGQLLTRFAGNFRLKGFEKAVGVYELVGRPSQAEAFQELHEAFAEALKAFQQHDLEAAEDRFRRVLAIVPGDGPAEFFLRTIAEIRRHPSAHPWTGAIELAEK